MTTNNSHKKYFNQTYESISRSVQLNLKPVFFIFFYKIYAKKVATNKTVNNK